MDTLFTRQSRIYNFYREYRRQNKTFFFLPICS